MEKQFKLKALDITLRQTTQRDFDLMPHHTTSDANHVDRFSTNKFVQSLSRTKKTRKKDSKSANLKPNTHRRRRRDETVKSRRVGGVYWA